VKPKMIKPNKFFSKDSIEENQESVGESVGSSHDYSILTNKKSFAGKKNNFKNQNYISLGDPNQNGILKRKTNITKKYKSIYIFKIWVFFKFNFKLLFSKILSFKRKL